MNTHDTYECATWLVPVAFGSAPKHLSQLMYEVASNFQHITRFLGLAACLLGWWSKRLLSAGVVLLVSLEMKCSLLWLLDF